MLTEQGQVELIKLAERLARLRQPAGIRDLAAWLRDFRLIYLHLAATTGSPVDTSRFDSELRRTDEGIRAFERQ